MYLGTYSSLSSFPQRELHSGRERLTTIMRSSCQHCRLKALWAQACLSGGPTRRKFAFNPFLGVTLFRIFQEKNRIKRRREKHTRIAERERERDRERERWTVGRGRGGKSKTDMNRGAEGGREEERGGGRLIRTEKLGRQSYGKGGKREAEKEMGMRRWRWGRRKEGSREISTEKKEGTNVARVLIGLYNNNNVESDMGGNAER